MATTQEILAAATKLGEMIATHPSAAKLKEAGDALEKDVDAQRVLMDYQRKMQELSEKEANQQPIEVEDKHALEAMQKKVMTNSLLGKLQMAQMDYLDLMRQVEDRMAGDTGEAAQAPMAPDAGPAGGPFSLE